jgi:hypothetical protein
MGRATAGNGLLFRGLTTRSEVPAVEKAPKPHEPCERGVPKHTHSGAWPQTWETSDVARVFCVRENLRSKVTWETLFKRLVILRSGARDVSSACAIERRVLPMRAGLTLRAHERRAHGA